VWIRAIVHVNHEISLEGMPLRKTHTMARPMKLW